MLFQLLHTAPRFMDVFSVLNGIDMTKMNEDALKAQKERKEEEEKKKKEEEDKYDAMSEEENKEFDNHKKADEIKLKGNEQYKKKF